MTDEQKAAVEKIINDVIAQDLPVTREEVSYEEARARGAIGVFDAKYEDTVSIYTVGAQTGKRGEANLFSLEFCGGPHVEHTGVLGHFKIAKEEAVSAGVRRIKAGLE
jgi:alanyl-tRNA synthetase